MINQDSPFSYTTVASLFGGVELSILLPGIGTSGKPQTVKISCNSEDDAPRLVANQLRKTISELVSNFLQSKERRFSSFTSNQNITILNALAGLRNEIKAWDKHSYWQHLNASILPYMDLLRTGNTASKFYQYDNDVYTFCKAVTAATLNNNKS